MNIIGLFFVTVVPFSTSFIGDYSNDFVATTVFECNLLVLGIVFLLQWVYATHKFRLISPDYPEIRIRYGIWRNLTIPTLSLAGIILGVDGFHSSTIIYLFTPLATWAMPPPPFHIFHPTGELHDFRITRRLHAAGK